MRLETSDDSSLVFQAGVLSILSLVVTKKDDFPGGLTGGVDEVKDGILLEFNGAYVEGP